MPGNSQAIRAVPVMPKHSDPIAHSAMLQFYRYRYRYRHFFKVMMMTL